jgi:YHS domain-containing protein
MTKDPVCEMLVNPELAEFTAVYEGKSYYFCSAVCKVKFEQNPIKYLKKKSWFSRLLEQMTRANQEKFGNKPPTCCSGH